MGVRFFVEGRLDQVRESHRLCPVLHFVVFGEHNLAHLIREYEHHDNTVRPHQGLGSANLCSATANRGAVQSKRN